MHSVGKDSEKQKNPTFMECAHHMYENQTSRMPKWNMRTELFTSRKIISQLLFRYSFLSL